MDQPQTGQTEVGHPQRRTVRAHLQRFTGRQFEIARASSVVAAAAQMGGKIPRMAADPHRETLFNQRNDLLVQLDPYIPRAGEISRFL